MDVLPLPICRFQKNANDPNMKVDVNRSAQLLSRKSRWFSQIRSLHPHRLHRRQTRPAADAFVADLFLQGQDAGQSLEVVEVELRKVFDLGVV
jgi:hypothetical protein